MSSSLAAATSAAVVVAPQRSVLRRRRLRSTVAPRASSSPSSDTMGQSSSSDVAAQPKFKLCYFDLFAKGLQCAMVANHSGLEWSGKDADFDFKALKHTVVGAEPVA